MKINQIIALVFCGLLFACTGTPKVTSPSATNNEVKDSTLTEIVKLSTAQLANASIEIGTVQKTPMHKVLKVSGVIDVPPTNIVSVSVPMGGYLKKSTLIPGTLVKKGAVLAVLEDPAYIELQQEYLTAKSKLEYVESDFNRQKLLNETKATSDKVYQLAKNDFESQKVLVKSLSEKLKLIGLNPASLNENTISRAISLYAPISGYITKVNVNMGKYVSPTDVLFEIIDPSDLHLRLIVFENDASNLKVGNKVSFYTNNKVAQKYSAKVMVITPNINEERATEVHCHMQEGIKNLYPGTFANAEIELDNAIVNALPENAVITWENKPHVFVKISKDSFKLVPVELGVVTNGKVEIKSDLGMQEIVTKNAYTLLMKLKNSGE